MNENDLRTAAERYTAGDHAKAASIWHRHSSGRYACDALLGLYAISQTPEYLERMVPVRFSLGASGVRIEPAPSFRPGLSTPVEISSPGDIPLAAASFQPDFDRAYALIEMSAASALTALTEARTHFDHGDFRQALTILDGLVAPELQVDVDFMAGCCLVELGFEKEGLVMIGESVRDLEGPALDVARRYATSSPFVETTPCRDPSPEWDRIVSAFHAPSFDRV